MARTMLTALYVVRAACVYRYGTRAERSMKACSSCGKCSGKRQMRRSQWSQCVRNTGDTTANCTQRKNSSEPV